MPVKSLKLLWNNLKMFLIFLESQLKLPQNTSNPLWDTFETKHKKKSLKYPFKDIDNSLKQLGRLRKITWQAGAELGQAQLKLEVVDEVLAKA